MAHSSSGIFNASSTNTHSSGSPPSLSKDLREACFIRDCSIESLTGLFRTAVSVGKSYRVQQVLIFRDQMAVVAIAVFIAASATPVLDVSVADKDRAWLNFYLSTTDASRSIFFCGSLYCAWRQDPGVT